MATIAPKFITARMARNQECREIELKLHPGITIEGKYITHSHRGSNIIFSAWIGNTPYNNREYSVQRMTVLYSTDFYKEHHDQLEWLVGIGSLEDKLDKEGKLC